MPSSAFDRRRQQVVLPNASTGSQGPTGIGIPASGAAGAHLVKNSATDYDTVWSQPRSFQTFADATARDAAITAPVQGMEAWLTTPKVYTYYDGTAWRGEWVTSFTPQIDQGVTTNITKTVSLVEYRYDGPMIEASFNMTLTGAGTAGSSVTVTIPVASVAGWVTVFAEVGAGIVFDASTNLRYVSSVELVASTKVSFGTDQIATGGTWGVSPNLALAAGDVIRFNVRYRWV